MYLWLIRSISLSTITSSLPKKTVHKINKNNNGNIVSCSKKLYWGKIKTQPYPAENQTTKTTNDEKLTNRCEEWNTNKNGCNKQNTIQANRHNRSISKESENKNSL